MKLTTEQYETLNEALTNAYNAAMDANDGHVKGAENSQEYAFYEGMGQTLSILGITMFAETATSCLQIDPANVG